MHVKIPVTPYKDANQSVLNCLRHINDDHYKATLMEAFILFHAMPTPFSVITVTGQTK